MAADDPLPLLPQIPRAAPCEMVVLEEQPLAERGFIRRRERKLVLRSPERGESAPFTYDEVERRALDAVVIAAHFLTADAAGEATRWVVLRSAQRPPVFLRDAARSPCPEPEDRSLWELPAGLVEPGESSPEGLRLAAARELLEETGFSLSPAALLELGPSSFPCPGLIAERHFFFHAEVRPDERCQPPLDGSPLEAWGEVIAVPLEEALRAAGEGRLADAKTELALRRLVEVLG